MKRLIKGAKYNPNDHSHDHQDPEMAKAMLIDGGLKRMRLISTGDTMAEVLRVYCPRAPILQEWEDAKK